MPNYVVHQNIFSTCYKKKFNLILYFPEFNINVVNRGGSL